MVIWVALGGAAGSVARYLLGGAVQRWSGATFPVGTLAVNVAGCFLIGAVLQHLAGQQSQQVMRGLVVVGFCGGFTTFSAFSSEVVSLAGTGAVGRAAAYVGLSVALSVLATVAGMAVVRAVPA